MAWIRRIHGLDTAYWGFLGVRTTFDIFQNLRTDMPYLLAGYGILRAHDHMHGPGGRQVGLVNLVGVVGGMVRRLGCDGGGWVMCAGGWGGGASKKHCDLSEQAS
ncbi:hypothetical protein Tco_1410548 [Tanacetum coccineum]